MTAPKVDVAVQNAECEIFEYCPTEPGCRLGSQAPNIRSRQTDEVSSNELDTAPSKPRAEILEGLVTAKELSYGASLDGRIAHIQDLILQLSLESSDPRIQELDGQLIGMSGVHLPQAPISMPLASAATPKPVEDPSTTSDNHALFLKLQSLESRLAKLETRIGTTDQLDLPDLASVLDDINQRLDLAGMTFDHITETSQQLVDASETHSAPFTSLANLDDLWARFQQLAPFIEQLPQISARLRTLASLHEYSASGAAMEAELQASVALMNESLRIWSSKLDSLERSLN